MRNKLDIKSKGGDAIVKRDPKFQYYLDKLKTLNVFYEGDFKDKHNMKLLLDGVQWQINNDGKGKVW